MNAIWDGWYTTPDRAFLWSEATGIVDLGSLEGGATQALAINEAGQVAGTSYTANGPRAFRWSAREGMVNLGVAPGFNSSFATDINEDGAISCFGTEGSSRQLPCFSVGNQLRALTVPSDPNLRWTAHARAINDLGQVAGAILESEPSGVATTQTALFWSTPSTNPMGARIASNLLVNDMNDAGVIVGERTDFTEVVWSPTDGVIELPPFGNRSVRGAAINDRGEVAGWYFPNERSRALLWRPVNTRVTGVTLTAAPQSPQPTGATITLTAASTGGVAPISYRFWVQRWGGEWQLLRD